MLQVKAEKHWCCLYLDLMSSDSWVGRQAKSDDVTIGAYSGIKDKNGYGIHEWDCLKLDFPFDESGHKVGVVTLHSPSGNFDIINSKGGGRAFYLNSDISDKITVAFSPVNLALNVKQGYMDKDFKQIKCFKCGSAKQKGDGTRKSCAGCGCEIGLFDN